MKLAKTKLKQIIKQEVIKKLLEQDDEKFKPPGRSRRDFLKGVGAAAAVGTGARTLSKMVDADKEARAADRSSMNTLITRLHSDGLAVKEA